MFWRLAWPGLLEPQRNLLGFSCIYDPHHICCLCMDLIGHWKVNILPFHLPVKSNELYRNQHLSVKQNILIYYEKGSFIMFVRTNKEYASTEELRDDTWDSAHVEPCPPAYFHGICQKHWSKTQLQWVSMLFLQSWKSVCPLWTFCSLHAELKTIYKGGVNS